MSLTERCVRYMMKIECRNCGEAVYPNEDDARDTVEYWTKYEDVRDFDDFKARVERTCDECVERETKPD